MQTIQIQIKQVYGEEKIYPVCDKAKTFAEMLGQKTLTPRDLTYIRALGYAFEVQTPTLSYHAA